MISFYGAKEEERITDPVEKLAQVIMISVIAEILVMGKADADTSFNAIKVHVVELINQFLVERDQRS